MSAPDQFLEALAEKIAQDVAARVAEGFCAEGPRGKALLHPLIAPAVLLGL